ncbi:hypothetical protein HOY82DRAFT_597670 [Tuber indicum]|nr:hypothetical protein HOY82DRAFT_597670 [Tuber indicum]
MGGLESWDHCGKCGPRRHALGHDLQTATQRGIQEVAWVDAGGVTKTLEFLNRHTGVIVSKAHICSKKFYFLFEMLIRHFYESGVGYAVGYLSGISTKVTCACFQFMTCLDNEVKQVVAK